MPKQHRMEGILPGVARWLRDALKTWEWWPRDAEDQVHLLVLDPVHHPVQGAVVQIVSAALKAVEVKLVQAGVLAAVPVASAASEEVAAKHVQSVVDLLTRSCVTPIQNLSTRTLQLLRRNMEHAPVLETVGELIKRAVLALQQKDFLVNAT